LNRPSLSFPLHRLGLQNYAAFLFFQSFFAFYFKINRKKEETVLKVQ
jgi:hypothetical protein